MSRLTVLIAACLLLLACSGDYSAVQSKSLPVVAPPQFAYPQLPVPQMLPYIDPKSGYEVLVPEGWRRVVLDETNQLSYSVTFESPPTGKTDRFSDYLLIEIVPGRAQPSFAHKPNERTSMQVDGNQVFRERYALDNYLVQSDRIDLVAWQISLPRPGYTVSFFAVGERREDARLERILIELAHSFSLQRAPFQLS